MPDPKRYTVRDPDSGRTVTFAWSGDAPPTDDDIAEVFAAAPPEPPLTRERPSGRPQSDAARDQVSPFSAMLGEAGETVGRWANDNQPALAAGGAALLTGGASLPVSMGAAALAGGAGAAGRETLRRATGEGSPLTGEALGMDILKEGATAGTLAGARVPLAAAGRVVGPAVARNARGISNTVRALSGSGFAGSVASGNVPAMLTSGAATIATHPSVVRGVGNLATRVGNSPMLNAAAGRLGLGANAARAGGDAIRQALLDALGEDPASTVP